MKSHHLIRSGDDFFNSMPKLKVLYSCDYSPESHCHPQLEDMRCLHLWGANLISLPKEAMQLQKLEQLTLRTTKPTVDKFTLTLKGLVEQFFRLRVLIFSTVGYDYADVLEDSGIDIRDLKWLQDIENLRICLKLGPT